MRVVSGMRVYEALDEIVEPRRTALLIIDMQNDFYSPDGVRGRMGYDLSLIGAIQPRLKDVLEAARATGVTVVFLQNSRLPDGRTDSGAWIRGQVKRLGTDGFIPYTVQDTWGEEIIPELQPRDGEVVLRKFRSSGFHQTMLDQMLKSRGIETVVLSGVVTDGCVMSTWRDAGFHDYYAVVLEDCVASYTRQMHEAAMTLMRRGEVVTSSEIIRLWSDR